MSALQSLCRRPLGGRAVARSRIAWTRVLRPRREGNPVGNRGLRIGRTLSAETTARWALGSPTPARTHRAGVDAVAAQDADASSRRDIFPRPGAASRMSGWPSLDHARRGPPAPTAARPTGSHNALDDARHGFLFPNTLTSASSYAHPPQVQHHKGPDGRPHNEPIAAIPQPLQIRPLRTVGRATAPPGDRPRAAYGRCVRSPHPPRTRPPGRHGRTQAHTRPPCQSSAGGGPRARAQGGRPPALAR